MPGMHAAGDDAVPKGIRRDDASAARPKKKSSADATQTPPLARAATTPAACTASAPAAAPSSSEITDLEGLRRHIDGRLDAMSESMLRSAVDAAASPFKRRASVEEEVTGRKGSSPPPLVRTPSNVPSISEDEWGGGEDDEGIEEIDGGGVPLSPMAEEDEGSWGDEGAPDVMMTFDGENWVPRRSSFDASSI